MQELPPHRDHQFLDFCDTMTAAGGAISLYHGERRFAVLNLKVGGPHPDVDLIEGTILFRGETRMRRKSGRPREDRLVQISRHALPYIVKQARYAESVGSEWLFPSPKNPAKRIHGNTFSSAFKAHARTAGFEHAFFHGLLHVHTTRTKSSGLADADGSALRAA